MHLLTYGHNFTQNAFYNTIGILDFYFFTGPTPASVVQQYLGLIGYPAMPAFWTLGQHQCRWGYNSLDTFSDMIEGYKKAKIPLDGIWMDIE